MLKLSEAIRLGSMLHPQGFGKWWDGKGTCAIGAAARAIGIRVELGEHFRTRRHIDVWPWAWDEIIKSCPVCSRGPVHTAHIIVHLNDQHRWTRERIAEWVATIEPTPPQTHPNRTR